MKTWIEVFRTNDSYAPLFLRLFVAAVMFPHGAQKMLGWFGGPGYDGSLNMFVQHMHIAEPLAFLDIITEFFAPIALLLGLLTRVSALGIGIIMAVAALMVHLPNGFFMNWTGQQRGEGFEYHLLMFAIALALIIQGGGKWALDALIYHKLRHEPGEVPILNRPAPKPA